MNILVRLMRAGEEADEVKAQRSVGRMWRDFRTKMGKESNQGFQNVGLMLRSDGIFSEKFDEVFGNGTAHYVGKAMGTYCKRHSNMEDMP